MGMFCYQCEQTAHGTGCVEVGVCGKSIGTADAQDRITYELMKMAVAAQDRPLAEDLPVLFMEGLFTTVTNVSFDEAGCEALADAIAARRAASVNDIVLAYLTSQPLPTIPIIGCGSAGQLRESLAACAIRLSPEELRQLREA